MSTNRPVIAVLFGGRSSEHEISCISAAAVLTHIDPAAYQVIPVGITREGVWWVYRGDVAHVADGTWEQQSACLQPAIVSPCTAHHGLLLLDKARQSYQVCRVDCFFPVMHGENSEDGRLQGLLEASGVPYVGCRTCSSALTMDKAFTKRVLEQAGISQAAWLQVDPFGSDTVARVEQRFSYPVFVKPANAGSSKGISRACNARELKSALALAATIDPKVIVEEAVVGKEIEVALLQEWHLGKPRTLATVCGQICADREFYSYESKYQSQASYCRIPADLEPGIAREVVETALRIFALLDCRGLSRADFFVTQEGKVIFNEINTMPGFTAISMYPKLWEHQGLGFTQLIGRLLEFALKEGSV